MEKMPPVLTPEELKKKDEEAQHEQWMKNHPEKAVSPEGLRESGPEVAEYEGLIVKFEAEHSLEALHLIIDLTPAEAPKHPIRESARVALNPIVALLKVITNETNVSTEKHAELQAHYKRVSNAVGMINRNKVDHNR